MSGLRVAIVTESASVWGAEKSLLVLLDQFTHLGIETTTVVADGSPFGDVLQSRGHHFVRYRFAKHPTLSKGSFSSASLADIAAEPFNIVSSAVRLARILKNFDLILSFSLWQAPEAIIAGRIRATPCILDLHETFSGNQSGKLIRAIGRFSSGIIAPSVSIVRNSGLTLGAKVRVIGRPVEINHSQKRGSHTERPLTVGIFGQIVPHKGVHQLVDAVEAMPEGSIQLMVVGGAKESDLRTPYEAELRNRVSKLSNSEFIDRVSAVDEYMRHCDMVVNLSKHEAFGRTVVEAIGCGAYPVVLDGSGPAEIVDATGVGKILGSAEELESFLKSVCQPSGQESLDELFRDRANWPNTIDQFAAGSVGKRYAAALMSYAKL
ncbi:glycosyltransferase family 4 protein [Rhodococcus fascians]|nr:glycosyltransferase family 4 protein [Rhodococcus fascians]MBY4138172.1 glycosyltransferase family 4 protein [Rhodococcus fascians]MBY4216121.1 glycosyltransferase family 4 protein [Rhodococcus fascians]MBY4220648.1 glycosyltransferase family 4 protein [Rhodococcus fascians]MBY4230807.1 glycosyltransferase family 4 protein [Rhodococcus fascians]